MENGLYEFELDRSHLRCEDRVILLVLLGELYPSHRVRSIIRLCIRRRIELFNGTAAVLEFCSLVHCDDEGPHSDPCGAKVAYLIDKDMPRDLYAKILAEASKERTEGKTVLTVKMNKNKKFQKEKLEAEGYTAFKDFYADSYKG